jgi:hypothetical protein
MRGLTDAEFELLSKTLGPDFTATPTEMALAHELQAQGRMRIELGVFFDIGRVTSAGLEAMRLYHLAANAIGLI